MSIKRTTILQLETEFVKTSDTQSLAEFGELCWDAALDEMEKRFVMECETSTSPVNYDTLDVLRDSIYYLKKGTQNENN